MHVTKSQSRQLDNHFSLGRLLRWIRRRVRDSIRSRRNYLLLSPVFSNMQQIYDTRSRNAFTVSVRDMIDITTLRQIFDKEVYNICRLSRAGDIMGFYRDILSHGKKPLIIDCGAHIGLSSLYFSRLFPEAQVIAIEPDADNVRLAQVNCSGQPNVKILHAGISNQPGRGVIEDTGLGSNAYRIRLSEIGDINIVSINSILEENRKIMASPFIAKIDIEGFEKTLFEESTDWVHKFPLIIVELHDWLFPGEARSASFLRCIASLKRDFVLMDENVFVIKTNG